MGIMDIERPEWVKKCEKDCIGLNASERYAKRIQAIAKQYQKEKLEEENDTKTQM